MSPQSQSRITMHMSLTDMVMALAEGNPGAIRALAEWIKSSEDAIMELLTLDTKRLYGSKIWEVYKNVCGEDIERFKYHVCVELPNQETGKLTVSGPWGPSLNNRNFWNRRQFGAPGSYWALKNPPTDPNYEFPIG